MIFLNDYTDERHKTCCIHCGAAIANVKASRDHVPTKSLLSKALRDWGARYERHRGGLGCYLPQVIICKSCNSGFSRDESYLLCTLHAVLAGSLYPDPDTHAEAARVLRSNRDIVRALEHAPASQLSLFDPEDPQPFTLYPNPDCVRRVVLKNARGHAYHELGEPPLGEPYLVSFVPLIAMHPDDRATFEDGLGGLGWPEVGSRMTQRVLGGADMVGGWIEVERGRYRYTVEWSFDIVVRTIIWEYLATETRWTP